MREVGVRGKGYGAGVSVPVRSFEDLFAWQEARKLVKDVYSVTNIQPFLADPALKSQMRRAGISAMANIAEGHGRTGPSEFAHHLSISLGSLAEFRSHLYVALDAGFISQEGFDTLMAQAISVTSLTARLRAAIANKRDNSSVKEEALAYTDEAGKAIRESGQNLPLAPCPLTPEAEVCL